MRIFLAALAIFALAMLAMAVGAMFGKRRLRGTCGGLAGLRDEQGEVTCDACATPSDTCAGVEDARRRESDGTVLQSSEDTVMDEAAVDRSAE